MNYFFDAYAILAVLKAEENYQQFAESAFITNTLHLAEVYFSLLKEFDEETATNTIEKIRFIFLEISQNIAIKAAKFKHTHKKSNMSYGDCIGYITAKQNNLLFLTGDEAFRNRDNVEFIK